uniref:Transmembrane protein 230 n=1 Tax=Noctiluca scintillans TaxID=2966 RepID=A0A7S1F0M8_NOCSC|mmetsp:Transcript_2391/g.6912  ORF Transcript_2391/g.6912 Transcript_2391/m.6912 type:complete len:105 (+) Transcript_2391:94-408(+)
MSDLHHRRGEVKQHYSRLREEPKPLRPPKVPLKELFLSFGLFIIGITFLVLGATSFWSVSFQESLPFTLIGAICFIPGAYHAHIFVMIFAGVPGYSYDMILTTQ